MASAKSAIRPSKKNAESKSERIDDFISSAMTICSKVAFELKVEIDRIRWYMPCADLFLLLDNWPYKKDEDDKMKKAEDRYKLYQGEAIAGSQAGLIPGVQYAG